MFLRKILSYWHILFLKFKLDLDKNGQNIIIDKKFIFLMDEQKPTILYYKMRGNAQVIRAILLEIGVGYNQIFVTEVGIPKDLKDQYDMEWMNLPYLIFEGQAICGTFYIMKYCCNRFGRPELLGTGIQEQVQIAEISMKYMSQKSKCMKKLLQSLSKLKNHPNQDQLLDEVSNSLAKFLFNMKHYQACKNLFLKSGGFLMKTMTILDFIYFELCFFINNFFGNKGQRGAQMYLQFFNKTDFYKKNAEKLHQYPFMIKYCDPQAYLLLKKLWKGDPSLLKQKD